MLPRSTISSIKCSPYMGRSGGCLAADASTLAPGSRGFTPASQLKANWIGLLSFIAFSRDNAYLPLPTVQAFGALMTPTMPSADSCGVLTPHCWSVSPSGVSLSGTPRRSPGVSPCTVDAQPLDLRLWSLMDMDFVPSRALVRPERLLSSFCSSARTFVPRFLQTTPRGVALALRYPSPPSGWERDLHPPST